MTSKAKRRRAKRARAITLPGGDTVPQKAAGRDRRHINQAKGDPMQTVLDARRRMMGELADRVDLRSAMAGDELGRALLMAQMGTNAGRQNGTSHPDASGQPKAEATGPSCGLYGLSALWGAVTHMRRTLAAYDRACGAPQRHPKCLSILTPPDHLGATADSPAFDDRPEEERSRSAIAAYMTLQGWLGHCDNAARSACLRAVVDDTGVNDLPGIILALQCVVDGHAGRKIVWRGRDA